MDESTLRCLGRYQRLEHDGIGIYVHPDDPDWFVPSSAADTTLQTLSNGSSLFQAAQQQGNFSPFRHTLNSFLCRLQRGEGTPYAGRSAHLKLDRLKECWFHVTHCCNLRCTHCMFSSGPTRRSQLSPLQLKQSVEEAQGLGCQVFYFTGGEPLIYQELLPICREILKDAQAHVVILTNGIALTSLGDEVLKLDNERVHFQVSLDGNEQHNDVIRGPGAFQRALTGVRFLRTNQFNVSLAMSVCRTNFDDMETLVSTAAFLDVKNVHYLWFFRKGEGEDAQFVPAEEIGPMLVRAYAQARVAGVLIDNVEIVKSQVFSLPGTRFDLSNAAWQSLAVGPDGAVYPSPVARNALRLEQRRVAVTGRRTGRCRLSLSGAHRRRGHGGRAPRRWHRARVGQ